MRLGCRSRLTTGVGRCVIGFRNTLTRCSNPNGASISLQQPAMEPLEPRLLLDGSYLVFSQQDVDVGNWPEGIVCEDFNDDGRADLAVANRFDDDVSVLYGLSGGGFGNRQDVAVGDPWGIVSGDFNADGRGDLAVTNVNDSDVSVLYGLPGGGFGNRQDVAVGYGPGGIVSGDFNSDGRADLAVTNNGDDDVSVLLNESEPAQDVPSLIPLSCVVTPDPVSAGDVLTVEYGVDNPNDYNVRIGLGCSIRKNGTTEWVIDVPHDTYVWAPPGASIQTRFFELPQDAEPGNYDVAFGLWETIGVGDAWSYTVLSSEFRVKAAWTLLLFMNPEDLSPQQRGELNEMEQIVYGDDLNVVVLVDFDGADDTYFGRLVHDTDPHALTLTQVEEQDMGDPWTLEEFVRLGATTYPAEQYALGLCAHGSGIGGIGASEQLDMAEILAGVENSGVGLDMVLFRCCVMAMTEVAYELRDVTETFVGSEAVITVGIDPDKRIEAWPWLEILDLKQASYRACAGG